MKKPELKEVNELFNEEWLQPGMVIQEKGLMWRFNPEWKKYIKTRIKEIVIANGKIEYQRGYANGHQVGRRSGRRDGEAKRQD